MAGGPAGAFSAGGCLTGGCYGVGGDFHGAGGLYVAGGLEVDFAALAFNRSSYVVGKKANLPDSIRMAGGR